MAPMSVTGVASDASGVQRPDFTGYWRLLRTENFDEFCRELGFPWVVRRAALRFMGGGSSADVIAQSGSEMKVTSLNPKGSWTRSYDTSHEVMQINAEGTLCKTTAWWEGRAFYCRMEPPAGASFGTIESSRYMRGDFMIVKTVVKLRKGTDATMYWFYDRMTVLQAHLRSRKGSLRRQIAEDQARVEAATRQDTEHLRDVLLDWQRWRSPADDYVPMMSPAYVSRGSRLRLRPGSPTASSPRGSISKPPSDAELNNLPAGIEVRTDTTRSIAKSESRSRLASEGQPGDRSIAKSDSRSRLAGLEFERGAAGGAAPAAGGGNGTLEPGLERVAAVAGHGVAAGQHGQQQAAAAPGGDQRGSLARQFQREISLSCYHIDLPPSSQPQQAGEALPGAAAAAGRPTGALSDITFQPSGGQLETIHSYAATRGSGSLPDVPLPPSVGPLHVRAPSGDSGTGRGRGHHVKSFSTESAGRGPSPSDGRSSSPAPWSGRSTPTHRPTASLSGPDAILAHKLQHYLDGRSISSVVPVATPNDTSEPQLLGMSPEQAEDTAVKLRELETDMLLCRQDSRHGFSCCGFVISRERNSLPEHLRVWEMTLE